MDFWFEFLDIHMMKKKQLVMISMAVNVNIYPILTPFLACWIVTAPTKRLLPLLLKNK
jgi:hypothetical protein